MISFCFPIPTISVIFLLLMAPFSWAMSLDEQEAGERRNPPRETFIGVSIDGGGYRGLTPAYLFLQLEEDLSQKHGYEVLLNQHVQGFAGTSTGSIIATALSVPHPFYPGYPRYRAAILPEIYIQNGKRIFTKTAWWGKIQGDPKYKRGPLDGLLSDYFGETTLEGVLPIRLLIPSYNLTEGNINFFHNFPGSDNAGTSLQAAVGASTAAPGCFKAKKIGDQRHIDGGVFCNNPTVPFILEIKKESPQKRPIIFSFGTGEFPRDFSSLESVNRLQVCKIPDLINLLLTACEQNMSHMAQHAGLDAEVIRVQAQLEREIKLDAVDEKTTLQLKKMADAVMAGEAYRKVKEKLDELCERRKAALEGKIRQCFNGEAQEIVLDLREQPILLSGEHLTEVLFDNIPAHLTSLILIKCNIWNEEDITFEHAGLEGPTNNQGPKKKLTIQAICKALNACKSLRSLDLSHNRLGDGGLAPLSSCSWLQRLKELAFKDNNVSVAGYKAIKDLMPYSAWSITTLDLRENCLIKSGLLDLFKGDKLLRWRNWSVEEGEGEGERVIASDRNRNPPVSCNILVIAPLPSNP